MNPSQTEWCDATLNPVVGCPHGCVYCYARGQAKRQKQRCLLCYEFVPHPHLERMEHLNPAQKPRRIFIDSMWDWNADGVKKEWLLAILEKIRECPQHTFQILSKRPVRYSRFDYPDNVWLGTSVTTNKDLHRVGQLLKAAPGHLKFVSVEPIHERISSHFIGLDWIIVGAETGHRKGRIVPEREWIRSIIRNAGEDGIPVFIKHNVGWHKRIREFPST